MVFKITEKMSSMYEKMDRIKRGKEEVRISLRHK